MTWDKTKSLLAILLTVIVVAIVVLLPKPDGVPPDDGIPFASHTMPRSGKWPTVRKHYLETHPVCEVCGAKEGLEVHHVQSYHTNPDLELEPTNFVVLCGHTTKANHHLWFGHLGDWKANNPHVREWIQAVKDRKEE